jgi:hypothetical protein
MKNEALKLALSCIRSSAEYKRGNASFIEAAEDVEQALEPVQPVQEPVAIPDNVRKIAKAMQKDGYRGPLSWARTLIDFVATYKPPPAAQAAQGETK